ncbi:aldo/keto reductase [bacterium]|nr:aldo/keto reductase [bacterium]
MEIERTVKLRSGYEIPVLAIGTWQTPNEIASRVVQDAIEVGYRHIDTASAYKNEEGVGQGIKKANIDRSKLFVTTKVPAEVKTYEETKKVIDESLEKLDLEYIDLVLIHAPKPWAVMFLPITKNYDKANLEVWKAMIEAKEAGKIRSIGVSNFKIKDIENLINNSTEVPEVNQIQIHIGKVNTELINYCKEKNIVVEAYSPMGTGRLIKNKKIKEIADKYNVSVPQLCIKYTLDLDTVSLPKTTHKEYMILNKEVDFEIKKEDKETLDNMKFLL